MSAGIRRKAGLVFAIVVIVVGLAMMSSTPATDCNRISDKAASGQITESDLRLYSADC